MALAALFFAVLCRVFWVGTDTAYAASAGAQTVADTALPRRRGDFFDRDGQKLTGVVPRLYALCVPGDTGYAALFPYVSYAAQAELYARRSESAPFLIEVGQDLTAQGICTVADAYRTLPCPIAVHLLGYLDGEGRGVAGLERAYDDVLSASGDEALLKCAVNAQGSLLAGGEPTTEIKTAGTGLGVQLTLDADIQRACEAIADETMTRGCLLVLDTATGDVLADVSRPEYDPDDVAKSIRADDTSLIDRAFGAFSAGSVFKVVVAAAACENGLDWFTHDCTGSVEVAGQTYRCAKGRAHGLLNLRGALEESCNCYFVELGRLLGGEAVLRTAQAFGFGTACAAAPGLKSSAGTLPDEAALQNAGQLATFSFGQGALTATPVQVAAMMNAAANGGTWQAPRFVQGVVDADGNLTDAFAAAEPRQACGADTARVLRSMLATVVTDGIGTQAQPAHGTAAGKTGTAQTGQFDENGEELLNYWFAGFYPADAPRYTVVVLQDGMLEPETSSAAIFARTADALYAIDGELAAAVQAADEAAAKAAADDDGDAAESAA